MDPTAASLDNLPDLALRPMLQIVVVVALVAGLWLFGQRRGKDHPDELVAARFLVTGSRTSFPLRTQAVMLVLILVAVPVGIWLLDRVVWPLLRHLPHGP